MKHTAAAVLALSWFISRAQGQVAEGGVSRATPEYCSQVEPIHPNFTPAEDVLVRGRDADGKFDLGLVKHGNYRLLLSPHRGFKQPEKLECSSTRDCTVDAVLIANPTDGAAAGCPIC